MTECDPFKSMKLAEMRETAKGWGMWDTHRLTKGELVHFLCRAESLYGKSLKELRSRARDWQVRNTSRLGKKALVSFLILAERLENIPVEDVKALAKVQGVEGIRHFNKRELIRQLLAIKDMQLKDGLEEEVLAVSQPNSRNLNPKLSWRRVLGFAIRLSSGFGVILCVAGLVLLPFIPSRAITRVDGFLDSTVGSVRLAADSLRHIGDSIGNAADVLSAARVSLTTVGETIEDTDPLMDSLSVFVGEQAPATIEATREALVSAESGALAIDQVLRGLAQLELLKGISYNPDQPLNEGISAVAAELEPLPNALLTVREDLRLATGNLDQLDQNLLSIGDELDTFTRDLSMLEEKLTELTLQLENLGKSIEGLSEYVPVWIWGSFAFLEIALIWIGLGQCAIFFVGDRLWRAT